MLPINQIEPTHSIIPSYTAFNKAVMTNLKYYKQKFNLGRIVPALISLCSQFWLIKEFKNRREERGRGGGG